MNWRETKENFLAAHPGKCQRFDFENLHVFLSQREILWPIGGEWWWLHCQLTNGNPSWKCGSVDEGRPSALDCKFPHISGFLSSWTSSLKNMSHTGHRVASFWETFCARYVNDRSNPKGYIYRRDIHPCSQIYTMHKDSLPAVLSTSRLQEQGKVPQCKHFLCSRELVTQSYFFLLSGSVCSGFRWNKNHHPRGRGRWWDRHHHLSVLQTTELPIWNLVSTCGNIVSLIIKTCAKWMKAKTKSFKNTLSFSIQDDFGSWGGRK